MNLKYGIYGEAYGHWSQGCQGSELEMERRDKILPDFPSLFDDYLPTKSVFSYINQKVLLTVSTVKHIFTGARVVTGHWTRLEMERYG